MPAGTAKHEKLTRVAALITDVDGVVTHGGLPYGPAGESHKVFHTRDNVALRLARCAGWPIAVITARDSPMVTHWAADLGITEVYQGALDKTVAVREFAARAGVALEQIAFLSDDILDLPAMLLCGVSACPADGAVLVRRKVDLVLSTPGGAAPLRELVETILEAQQRTDEVLRIYYRDHGIADADIDRVLGGEAEAQPARIGFSR